MALLALVAVQAAGAAAHHVRGQVEAELREQLRRPVVDLPGGPNALAPIAQSG
jgi:hypothetical protein